VGDLVVPSGVTVLTDAEEPLARVQQPRSQEEFAAIPGAEAPVAAPVTEAAEATGSDEAAG
jgi:hypothetical protein